MTANVMLVLYAAMLLAYVEVPAEASWLLERMESTELFETGGTELVETKGTELIGTEVIELETAVANPLLAVATSSSSK